MLKTIPKARSSTTNTLPCQLLFNLHTKFHSEHISSFRLGYEATNATMVESVAGGGAEREKKVHEELTEIRARQVSKGHMADNSASLYASFASDASELFEAFHGRQPHMGLNCASRLSSGLQTHTTPALIMPEFNDVEARIKRIRILQRCQRASPSPFWVLPRP
ncbi:hypothetical protein GJ744_008863 [Endocarpon pusillum]|uniref:Uncharacterized protein n=1 Tax=Endocarpon pusillum TaxID=364733 RepID=A0A8H7ASJ1_9EURO|nr:hypothetical protein GJ744_008863 [Endocarpon pusillum]